MREPKLFHRITPVTRENELNGGRGLFQNLLESPIAKVYSPNVSIQLKWVLIHFSSVYLISKHPKLPKITQPWFILRKKPTFRDATFRETVGWHRKMSAYFLRLTLIGLVLKQICGQKRISLENCTGLKDRLINKFTKESWVRSSGKSAEKKETIDCKEDARNKSRYLGKRRMRSNKKGRVFSKLFSKILHIKRTFKDPMHTPFLPSPSPSPLPPPFGVVCLPTYSQRHLKKSKK